MQHATLTIKALKNAGFLLHFESATFWGDLRQKAGGRHLKPQGRAAAGIQDTNLERDGWTRGCQISKLGLDGWEGKAEKR